MKDIVLVVRLLDDGDLQTTTITSWHTSSMEDLTEIDRTNFSTSDSKHWQLKRNNHWSIKIHWQLPFTKFPRRFSDSSFSLFSLSSGNPVQNAPARFVSNTCLRVLGLFVLVDDGTQTLNYFSLFSRQNASKLFLTLVVKQHHHSRLTLRYRSWEMKPASLENLDKVK